MNDTEQEVKSIILLKLVDIFPKMNKSTRDSVLSNM